MADGDKASSPTRGTKTLLNRSWAFRTSYFFDPQVKKCASEQLSVLHSILAKREKEAQISYDKHFADKLCSNPQIDSVFSQLLFDVDAQMDFEALTDDLRTRAGEESEGKDVTRLLDFLFVTLNWSDLREELALRNTHYDLYEEETKKKFGSMAKYVELLSKSGKSEGRTSHELAQVLSMLVTGQREVVSTGLCILAKTLDCPWDALVLARFFYGMDDEVTKMVRDVWMEAVMKNDQFSIINIARSLSDSNLAVVARSLAEDVTSKTTDPTQLYASYRCLAIVLAANDISQPELQRRVEAVKAQNLMRNIFVTLLGWGYLSPAKCLLTDMSKRVPPADVPSDICELVLGCNIELVELLMRSQGIGTDEHPHEASAATSGTMFHSKAMVWRGEINRVCGEMSKLKTDQADAQNVVHNWMLQLMNMLLAPLIMEVDLSKKMECVWIAAELTPQMLRWAAWGNVGEPFILHWPERRLSIVIKDDSIVLPDHFKGPRNRSISTGSSRSAATAREEGKRLKKGGDAKEEGPAAPVQDKSQTVQRTEGNKQNKERVPSMEPRDLSGLMSQPPPMQRPDKQYNQSAAGGDRGQANQQSRDGSWRAQGHQVTQDVRRSHGGGSEHNGANAHVFPATHATNYTPNAAYNSPGGGMAVNSPRGDLPRSRTDLPRAQMPHESLMAGSGPTSSASSSSLADKIDQYCSSPDASMHPMVAEMLEKKKQELLAAQSNAASSPTTPQQPPSGSLSGMREKQLQQSQTAEAAQPTPSTPSVPKSPPPSANMTQEQIQAAFEENVKKNAELRAAKAEQQTAGGQQPPASHSTQQAIPPRPTMGTAAANEVRARRSMESVQPVQQISPSESVQQVAQSEEQDSQSEKEPEPVQPPVESSVQSAADSHYEQLMQQMEQKGNGDDNRSIAPDPAEMNKLFTGTNKGQATLPPCVLAEQEASAAAAAAALATIMVPQAQPPVPTFVAAAAAESVTSSQPSLNLTQPTPSELSSDFGHSTRTCTASSEESGLTPITEVSQETAFSESDGPGLGADESTDNVFDEGPVPVETPLQVNVVQSLKEEALGSLSEQITPNEKDLFFSQSSQDTPATTPQLLSPMQTESSATERSELTTVVPTTSIDMATREEAQDANQLHQPILMPVPSTVEQPSTAAASESTTGGQKDVAFVAEPTTMTTAVEQSGDETTQAQTVAHPEAAAASPIEQQPHAGLPLMPAESSAAPFSSAQPLPPPSVAPVDTQSTQSNEHIEAPMPAVTPAAAPVVFDAPAAVVSEMTQASASASSQQMGQYASAPVDQQQQPVHQMEAASVPQRPIAHDATEQAMQQASLAADEELDAELVVAREDKSASSIPASTGEQLSVDCGEVKELMTSCGIAYKFNTSPVNSEIEQTVVPMRVAAEEKQQQLQQGSVQEPVPVQETQGFSYFDSLLSSIQVGGAGAGEVAQSAPLSSSMSNTQSGGVGTVTTAEIDEHAGMRRQEASESGDMASEIGSITTPHATSPSSHSYSMPPSIPSTAVTTPEPQIIEQQNLDYKGDDGWNSQTSATSFSTTSASGHGHGDWGQPQVQPTLQTMQQKPQPVASQSSDDLPLYQDPFSQPQQSQQPPQQQQNLQQTQQFIMPKQQHPEAAPNFGTGAANSASTMMHQPQSGGFGGHHQSQNQGFNNSQNQDHGNHYQGGRGSRGGRGGGGMGRGGGGGRSFGGGSEGGVQSGGSGFGGGGGQSSGFGGSGDHNRGAGDRPKGCFNCGQEGHQSKFCPQQKKEGARGGHSGSGGYGRGGLSGQGGHGGQGFGQEGQRFGQGGQGFAGGDNGQQPSFGTQPGSGGQTNFGNQPSSGGQSSFGNKPNFGNKTNFGNQGASIRGGGGGAGMGAATASSGRGKRGFSG